MATLRCATHAGRGRASIRFACHRWAGLNGSHFEHKNPEGRLWTITLHKDKKGRRLLKGRRQDGNKWELKEQK